MAARYNVLTVAAIAFLALIGASILIPGIWSPMKWLMYLGEWRDMCPVEFYGRVVDDAGQPVAGAEVSVWLTVFDWTWIFGDGQSLPQKDVHFTVASDKDGRFAVTGRRATSLTIEEVRKTGYVYSLEDNRDANLVVGVLKGSDRLVLYHSASRRRPDPLKPVDVRLRAASEGPSIQPGSKRGRARKNLMPTSATDIDHAATSKYPPAASPNPPAKGE